MQQPDQIKCQVIPNELADNEMIIQAKSSISFDGQCQFHNSLKPEYEYKGQHFCILHLPYEYKKNNSKESGLATTIFNDLVKEGARNFYFINVVTPKIIGVSEEERQISFVGSFLWSLNLENVSIKNFYLSFSQICGISKIDSCNIKSIEMDQISVSSYLRFLKCKVNILVIKNSQFYFDDKATIRQDSYNYGIHFNESHINILSFNRSTCQLELRLDQAIIGELNFWQSIFYLSPSFFNTDFIHQNKILVLPDQKSFNLKLLEKQYGIKWSSSKFLREPKVALKIFLASLKTRKKYKGKSFLHEYYKFREIYNIAKQRGMYKEQSEYFFLMQYCLENTGHEMSWWYKFFSRCYRIFSGYGQSISRPILFLLLIYILSAFFYSLPTLWEQKAQWVTLKPYFLLSIQQIIKPYSQLFNNSEGSFYSYLITCIESTLSIACLALLVIALRWNFRKS